MPAEGEAAGPSGRGERGAYAAGPDVFRDSPVRYLGYANELGEAFGAFISRGLYRLSYGVAGGYAVADAADKGYRSLDRGEGEVAAGKHFADALVWQGLASVMIPGFTINRVVAAATVLLKANRPGAPAHLKLGPTLCGLAAIPLIIAPIDRAVDWGMDETLRKVFF